MADTTARNDLLRHHVTRVGFALTLTKNQIAELVHMHVTLADPRSTRDQINAGDLRLAGGHGRTLLSSGIVSRHALMARGLVVHHHIETGRPITDDDHSYRDSWSLTAAGRAVVDLLKESGLYADAMAAIPWAAGPPAVPEYTPQDEAAHHRERVTKAEKRVRDLTDELRRIRRERDDADRAKRRAESELWRLKQRVKDMVASVGDMETEAVSTGA